MRTARGGGDEQICLEKLFQKNNPQEKFSTHIDFEVFRKSTPVLRDSKADTSNGGSPSCDKVLMFKILILQCYYKISGNNTVYVILDRLGFMRFLGLGIHDRVAYDTTIWLFHDRLAKTCHVEILFKILDRKLSKDRIILNTCKMADESLVEIPSQLKSRESNEKLREEDVP